MTAAEIRKDIRANLAVAYGDLHEASGRITRSLNVADQQGWDTSRENIDKCLEALAGAKRLLNQARDYMEHGDD